MSHKVLLIDDSRMLRRELEAKFRSLKFKIVTAATWEEGKRLLKEIAPNTLILDYYLQDDISADEHLDELDAMGCDIPVILISAADPTSIKKLYARRPQVHAYLNKPVKPEEIEKVLNSLCSRRNNGDLKIETSPVADEPEILGYFVKKGYTFVGQIGVGGMCKVYKFRQDSLGREVVLKVLAENRGKDSNLVKRFAREAKTLAGLSHPNLLTIYDYGSQKDVHYILMEYVKGKDLKCYMQKNSIDLKFALKVMFEMGSALVYLHGQNLIHRDLKPSNVMIGENNAIKIIDFGLVKPASGVNDSESSEGAVLGTPEYMSPEQTLGYAVDFRSDIYSLGIIMYEMLAGTLPFKGDFAEEIIYMQRNCRHIPLRKQNPEIRQGISNIVDKMLAKIPKNRFQTVEELLRRLRLEKYLSADRSKASTRKKDLSACKKCQETRRAINAHPKDIESERQDKSKKSSDHRAENNIFKNF